MTHFSTLSLLPADPILSLPIVFAQETNPRKVNLGVGIYCDENGSTEVLESVKEAEGRLYKNLSKKNYLPIEGNREFLGLATSLVFGRSASVMEEKRSFSIQTVGGTGALRLGGELLHQRLGCKKIYIPDPTWPNHKQIFSFASMELETYPYWDRENPKELAFVKWVEAIDKMEQGAAILLHGCCHNPTGFDPSKEQWELLLDLLHRKGVMPFFDLAYQGFGVDIEEDAFAVRKAAERGMEFLTAVSHSKNFGLYGERSGLLIAAASDPKKMEIVGSHLKQLSRAIVSNPPIHPALIVATILSQNELREKWEKELRAMRHRIESMRHLFVEGMQEKIKGRDLSYLLNQKGMFSYCGLTNSDVKILKEKWGIYTPPDGRINVAGINKANLPYILEALTDLFYSPSHG